MKWETIKARVIAAFKERIFRDPDTWAVIHRDLIACGFQVPESMKPLNHKTVHDAYVAEIERVVGAWDVRGVGRLRKVCPSAFPRNLREGPLEAYMADNPNCDWMIKRASTAPA